MLQGVNCQEDIQYGPINSNNANTATDVCHICGQKYAGLATRVIPSVETDNEMTAPDMTACQSCVQHRGAEFGSIPCVRLQICRSMTAGSVYAICQALIGMAEVQPAGLLFGIPAAIPFLQPYSSLETGTTSTKISFLLKHIGLIDTQIFLDMAQNKLVYCAELIKEIQSNSWKASKSWFTTNWEKMYTRITLNQLPIKSVFTKRITSIFNVMTKHFHSNITPEKPHIMLERAIVLIGGKGRGTSLHVDW